MNSLCNVEAGRATTDNRLYVKTKSGNSVVGSTSLLRTDYDEYFYHVGGRRGGESREQFMVRYRGFLKCLKDKGYDYLNENKCGPLKENRGICK